MPEPSMENVPAESGPGQPAAGDAQCAAPSGMKRAAGRGWKARLRWLGLRIIAYYSIIVVIMFTFQRSLIYQPSRFARADTRAGGLPEGRVHDIVFRTEDGLDLHGWHVLPEGHACQSAADCDAELARAEWLFLFFHGNGGSRIDRAPDCRSLAGDKSHVFIADYRGYAENSGSPTEEGLALDARALWRHATRERKVRPERIVLYGESLGGGVATRLASELCAAGTPPAGLILVGTFSSLTDVAAYHYPWLPVRLVLLDRYASVGRASALTCPVLQIHGADDDIIPVKLGRRLFEAIPEKSAGGIPKQFAEIAGAGHNDLAESTFQPLVRSFLAAIGAAARP